MFQGKIEGIMLLKDGTVSVRLTCNGDDMSAIAGLRKGTITVYGENELPNTDIRAAVLVNIRTLAEQVAEAISKELEPQAIMPDSPDLFEQVAEIAYQGVSDGKN